MSHSRPSRTSLHVVFRPKPDDSARHNDGRGQFSPLSQSTVFEASRAAHDRTSQKEKAVRKHGNEPEQGVMQVELVRRNPIGEPLQISDLAFDATAPFDLANQRNIPQVSEVDSGLQQQKHSQIEGIGPFQMDAEGMIHQTARITRL